MFSDPLSSMSESEQTLPESVSQYGSVSEGLSVWVRPIDRFALEEWALLHQSCGELPFYLHPDWVRALVDGLFDSSLSICSVYSNENKGAECDVKSHESVEQESGKLILMLVLQKQEKSTVKTRFTLFAPMHDHLTLGDVLIGRDVKSSTIQSAIAAVIEKCECSRLVFHNLPGDSLLQHSIGNADFGDSQRQEFPVWIHSPARESAYFDLADGSSTPPGKLKRNLKRLRRKLEEKGELESRFYSADAALQAFEKFMTVEASGWKGKNGTASAINADPHLVRFYETLLQPQFEGITPEIHHLCLDDEVIAVQYALSTDVTQNILKIAYNEEYGYFSPGSLLLEETMQRARDQGFEKLSLVTNPLWANRWSPRIMPVSRVVAHRSSVLALSERTLLGFRQRLRGSLTGTWPGTKTITSIVVKDKAGKKP